MVCPASFSEVRKHPTYDNAAIARDHLIHIAIVIQTDIIMALQLAARYESAGIDFTKLRLAAIANRKSALGALDELKQRILVQHPSLRTYSVDTGTFSDVHGSFTSRPASRGASSGPISETPSPKAVSDPANGDSQNGLSSLLVRYFYEQKRGRAVSNTENCLDLLDTISKNNNSRAPFHLLRQMPSLREQALTMKDIDQIIAAYQGIRIEGDRADTLARLTGNQDQSKRDTLAVLQGNFDQQPVIKMPYQDGLHLHKELPPLPKNDDIEYPAYNPEVFGGNNERMLNKWVEQQRQQPVTVHQPVVSRWSTTSAGSSVYSERTVNSSDIPSLYYDDSRSSSRASATTPAEPASPVTQYFPSKPNSSYGTVPYCPLDTMRDPRNPSSLPSTRANSPMRLPGSRTPSPMRQPPSRSLTPTIPSQRPTTPSSTAWSRNASPEPRGRSRDHLHPTSNIDTAPMLHLLRPVASSSQLSITPSVKSTVTTVAQEKMMNGRPCKDNNYWGFCKGAWATREDTSKGLSLSSKPEGMFSTTQVWQCRHCLFEGPSCTMPHATKKNKKEVVIDKKVHVSAAGIRYRWSFLAKSHVKKSSYSSGGRNTSGEETACNYGCVICSVEGTVTGVYGSVELLMDHVAHEHVYTGNMNNMTMTRSKIVVGRMAGNEEDWDVNIPSQSGLLF